MFHPVAVRSRLSTPVLFDALRAQPRSSFPPRLLEVSEMGGQEETVHNRKVSLHQKGIPLPVPIYERLQGLSDGGDTFVKRSGTGLRLKAEGSGGLEGEGLGSGSSQKGGGEDGLLHGYPRPTVAEVDARTAARSLCCLLRQAMANHHHAAAARA